MSDKQNPIHSIAKFITSSSAVTLGLLVIIMAMIFETQTLLYIQLQSVGMQGYKLYVTSFGLAIGIEFIILLFTANNKVSTEGQTGNRWRYTNKTVFTAPVVFGISSFIINFYFWKAYDFSRDWQWILFSIFISWLLAYINYKLSELFITKWSAHLNQVDLQVKCNELEVIKDELEVKRNELRVKYDELISVSKIDKQNIKNIEHDYSILLEEVEELRSKLSRKKTRKL
ncbi:hypothetical protein [Marivirga sp.]|uniref:hypothetical protein n=1 Tax=Marivirga sp. TaxID=2018662 RepID=UPI003DA78067